MVTNDDKETYLNTIGELREFLKELPDETPVRVGHFAETKVWVYDKGTVVIN